MIEIAGKPILAYNLELLARAGVHEAIVNLHYRPESIRTYFGSKYAGISLAYAYEPELLGTAGAARNVAEFLRADDFAVIYGDNLSTIDFSKLLAAHRSNRADVTLAV